MSRVDISNSSAKQPLSHLCHSCVSFREETSNNRIRSSMPVNTPRPIDHVPTAGARTGHANGAETTEAGLGATDANLEDGEGTLSPRTTQDTPELHT